MRELRTERMCFGAARFLPGDGSPFQVVSEDVREKGGKRERERGREGRVRVSVCERERG